MIPFYPQHLRRVTFTFWNSALLTMGIVLAPRFILQKHGQSVMSKQMLCFFRRYIPMYYIRVAEVLGGVFTGKADRAGRFPCEGTCRSANYVAKIAWLHMSNSYVELNIGSSHKVDTEHFNRSMIDN